MLEEIGRTDSGDTSSHYDRSAAFWTSEPSIQVGKTVGWLFIAEEHGRRMKA